MFFSLLSYSFLNTALYQILTALMCLGWIDHTWFWYQAFDSDFAEMCGKKDIRMAVDCEIIQHLMTECSKTQCPGGWKQKTVPQNQNLWKNSPFWEIDLAFMLKWRRQDWFCSCEFWLGNKCKFIQCHKFNNLCVCVCAFLFLQPKWAGRVWGRVQGEVREGESPAHWGE